MTKNKECEDCKCGHCKENHHLECTRLKGDSLKSIGHFFEIDH